MTERKGWIGVDLDGTMAEHHDVWIIGIGAPISRMVERVKRWLAEGREVRILTARVARGWDSDAYHWTSIRNWSFDTFGQYLPVTSEKDPNMIELWDDRAVQVIPNTGITMEEYMQDQHDQWVAEDRGALCGKSV